MWLGYLGLIVTYICLITIMLWVFICSSVHVMIKVILIAVTIWYGLALYYIPSNFMGWPTIQAIPDSSRVLSIKVQEPDRNSTGAIYFWLNTHPTEKKVLLIEFLDPRKAFLYYGKTEPKAYKLPYSRSLHERIIRALKKKSRIPGGQMIIGQERKKKGKGSGKKDQYLDDQIKFKIINPIDLLSK